MVYIHSAKQEEDIVMDEDIVTKEADTTKEVVVSETNAVPEKKKSKKAKAAKSKDETPIIDVDKTVSNAIEILNDVSLLIADAYSMNMASSMKKDKLAVALGHIRSGRDRLKEVVK